MANHEQDQYTVANDIIRHSIPNCTIELQQPVLAGSGRTIVTAVINGHMVTGIGSDVHDAARQLVERYLLRLANEPASSHSASLIARL